MAEPSTWEDELQAQGRPIRPGASYRCPGCEAPRHAFAIVRTGDGEWRCSHCLAEPVVGGPPALTWEDVHGGRMVLLESTDWAVLPDQPAERRSAYAKLRQDARDLTKKADPKAAMALLVELRAQSQALKINNPKE